MRGPRRLAVLLIGGVLLVCGPVRADEGETITIGHDDEAEESITIGHDDDEAEESITIGHDDDEAEESITIGHAAAAAPAAAGAFEEAAEVTADLSVGLGVDLDWTADDHHVGGLSLVGRLGLKKKLGERFRLMVQGRLRHHHLFARPSIDGAPDREGRVISEVELREAWLDVYLPWVDLRFGNQIFAWGANEGVAPADILNPTDLRLGFSGGLLGGTEGKLAVPALSARAFFGPATLRVALLPVFVPSRLWLFGYDWAVVGGQLAAPFPDPSGFGFHWTGVDQIQPFLLHTRLPPSTPQNLQAAARLELRLGQLDLGVSYFDGWDRFPRSELDPDLSALMLLQSQGQEPPLDVVLRLGDKLSSGETLFETWHARMRVVSLDAEMPVGSVMVRADLGYSPGRTLFAVVDDPVAGPLMSWTEERVLSGALGLEYLDVEGLSVGLIGHFFGALDVGADRVLVIFEDTREFPAVRPADGRFAVFYGAIAFGRWSLWDDRVELFAALVWNASVGDWIAVPGVTWRVTDHHRLELTAELLEGPTGTAGGIFGHNDQVGIAWTVSY